MGGNAVHYPKEELHRSFSDGGPEVNLRVKGLGFNSSIRWAYSPPSVDRIWGIWGSYYPKPYSIYSRGTIP